MSRTVKKPVITDRELKAWLNYNCSQGNNWIVLYKIEEMVSHQDLTYFETTSKTIVPKTKAECRLVTSDLRHVYFAYMTENILISLIETHQGDIYLIHNNLNIDDDVDATIETTGSDTLDSAPATDGEAKEKDFSYVEFTDEMLDNYHQNQDNLVKKVETVESLPQVHSVISKLTKLTDIRHLPLCLSAKDMKAIGLRTKKWLECDFKKAQKEELAKICFMDFIHIGTQDEYVTLFEKYLKQCGDLLNLTHNYSVTPEILAKVSPTSHKIRQLIVYQNFQLSDFMWMENFRSVRLLNLWYSHQIEQKHIEQMVEILPELDVFNLHSCCRVNLRILIPLLKLSKLTKLAIDDPSFWCQKSIHEVFILPNEWRNLSCASLDKLALNSKNLTLDVLDYILQVCPNLQHVLVDDGNLQMITRNIVGGNQPELITFHSWQSPNKGFEISKKVTFKNMYKDTYNSQMFSESMLKKIKENREKSNEVEQIPLP
jgi:hypothetical protein